MSDFQPFPRRSSGMGAGWGLPRHVQSAAKPRVYILIAAILAAFVAYGRYSVRPIPARATSAA